MFAHHIQESLIAQIGAYNDPVAAKALNDFALTPSKILIYPISVCIFNKPSFDLKYLVQGQGLALPSVPLSLKYFSGTVQLFNPSTDFEFVYVNSSGGSVSTFRAVNIAPDKQYIVQDMIWSKHTAVAQDKNSAIFTGIIVAATY